MDRSYCGNVHTKSNEIKPKVGWITVNRNCNMRCQWCYAKGIKYSGEISFDFAKRLVLIMKSVGIEKIILIGGEPTLWRHLFQFNAFCRDLGIKTIMATNAFKFSDDTFWSRYKASPNDSIGISLKGYDDISYNSVAGIDNFDLILSGLKRGIDFFHTGVGVVYSSLNSDELVSTAKFAKYVGANYLNIGFCTPTISGGNCDGSLMVDPRQIASNLMGVYDVIDSIMGSKVSFSMKLPLCLFPENFIECLIRKKQISTLCQLKHKMGLIFDMQGNVIVCNTLSDYPIGKLDVDFSTSEGLLEFLNSASVISTYNRLNSYPTEKCISCEKYSMCGGGCVTLWSIYKANEIIGNI